MSSQILSAKEVQQRAEHIYEAELRFLAEDEANIGKIVMIDTETGHYALGEDSLTANKQLRATHPEADPYALFALRVGYDAVYSFGGVLTRTKQ